MPTYTFEDTNTGDVYEMTMMISERDVFVVENPHMKQLIAGAPMIVSGVGSGGVKPGGGLDEVFAKASEAHPDSPLAQRYGKKGSNVDARKDLLKVLHYALIQLYVHDEKVNSLMDYPMHAGGVYSDESQDQLNLAQLCSRDQF